MMLNSEGALAVWAAPVGCMLNIILVTQEQIFVKELIAKTDELEETRFVL